MKGKTYKYSYYPYAGIYAIVNKVNGKMYIGQSIHVYNRIRSHFTALKKGKDNLKLQRGVNKHGIENFYGKVIHIITDPYLLDSYEDFYIDYFNTRDCGYNIAPGGKTAGDTLSKHPNKDKIYQKIWDIKRERGTDKSHTTPHTKEAKQKVSDSLKEFYENGGEPWNKGQKLDDDYKKKLSDAHKGIKPSNETRKKMSIAHKGHKFSEERNNNVSEGLKRYHENGGKIANTTMAYSSYSRRISKLIRLCTCNLEQHVNEYISYLENKYEFKLDEKRLLEINEKHNLSYYINLSKSLDNILEIAYKCNAKLRKLPWSKKWDLINRIAQEL